MTAPSSVIVLDSDEESELTRKRKKRHESSSSASNVSKRQKLSNATPILGKKHKPLIVALDSRLLLTNITEPQEPLKPTSSPNNFCHPGNPTGDPPRPSDSGGIHADSRRQLDTSCFQDSSLVMRMIDGISADIFMNSTAVLNESNFAFSQVDVSQLLDLSLLDQTFSAVGDRPGNASLTDLFPAALQWGRGSVNLIPAEGVEGIAERSVLRQHEDMFKAPQPIRGHGSNVVQPNHYAPSILAPPFLPALANPMLSPQLLGNLGLLAQLHLQSLLAGSLNASAISGIGNSHAVFPVAGSSNEGDVSGNQGMENIVSIAPIDEDPDGRNELNLESLEAFPTASIISVTPIIEETPNVVVEAFDGVAEAFDSVVDSPDNIVGAFNGVEKTCNPFETALVNIGETSGNFEMSSKTAGNSTEPEVPPPNPENIDKIEQLVEEGEKPSKTPQLVDNTSIVFPSDPRVPPILATASVLPGPDNFEASTGKAENSFESGAPLPDSGNLGKIDRHVGKQEDAAGEMVDRTTHPIGSGPVIVPSNFYVPPFLAPPSFLHVIPDFENQSTVIARHSSESGVPALDSEIVDKIERHADKEGNITGERQSNSFRNKANESSFPDTADYVDEQTKNSSDVNGNYNIIDKEVRQKLSSMKKKSVVSHKGVKDIDQIESRSRRTVSKSPDEISDPVSHAMFARSMDALAGKETSGFLDSSMERAKAEIPVDQKPSSPPAGYPSLRDDQDAIDNDVDDDCLSESAEGQIPDNMEDSSEVLGRSRKESTTGNPENHPSTSDSPETGDHHVTPPLLLPPLSRTCLKVSLSIRGVLEEIRTEASVARETERPEGAEEESRPPSLPVRIKKESEDLVMESSSSPLPPPLLCNVIPELSVNVGVKGKVMEVQVKAEPDSDDVKGVCIKQELCDSKEVKINHNDDLVIWTGKSESEVSTGYKEGLICGGLTGNSDGLTGTRDETSRRISIPLSALQDTLDSGAGSPKVETCHTCGRGSDQITACPSGHVCCLVCLFDQITTWLASNSKDVFDCQHRSCTSFYNTTELRRVLPESLVKMMEEKLEREYLASTNDLLRKVNSRSERVAPIRMEAEDHWLPYDCWSMMQYDKPYTLISLDSSSKEFSKVSRLFHKTMRSPRATIRAVRRLLNPELWQYYTMKRDQLMRHLPNVKHQLERMLFHGIKREFLDIVCTEGVDWRKCGISHGILYGEGTYFVRDASYAHQFTDRSPAAPRLQAQDIDDAVEDCLRDCEKENLVTGAPVGSYEAIRKIVGRQIGQLLDERMSVGRGAETGEPPHSRYILLARVFVGRFARGRHKMRRPPPVDPSEPYGPCYDSLVNCIERPTLFVVSDINQSYPEYVVEYTNLPKEGPALPFSDEGRLGLEEAFPGLGW